MKYLVDMALSPKTVKFLKEKGYDAVRVNEVIEGREIHDKSIFDFAITNDY